MFKVLKTEGAARRGEFSCPHGTVQTPVFMNVGTQAAIKGALSAADLEKIGTNFPIPIICICVLVTRLCATWAACTNL